MANANMGRPFVYDQSKPRRPRTITLTDELWEVLKQVAGEGKRAEYIEAQLRAIPEVADKLK